MSEISEVKHWNSQLREALVKKSEWMDEFHVEKAREFFEGKQRPPEEDGSDWITINKVYSHLLSQLPKLYSVDPKYYIKPSVNYDVTDLTLKTVEDFNEQVLEFEKKAEIRQAYLNKLKVQVKLKEKARLSIQDCHFAFGVIKTFYKVNMIKNPNAGKPIVDEDQNPILDQEGNPIIEPDFMPTHERYEAARTDPDDIIFDADAGPLSDSWNWIGERIKSKVSDLRKDSLINKKAIPELIKDLKSEKHDVENKVVEYWKIYNIKDKQILGLSTHSNRYIIKPTQAPEMADDNPFEILRFTLRSNSPYPIPPFSQGLDPQTEYNRARSRIQKHRKRFNRKYEVYTPGLEDESEMDKLTHGEDGECIRKSTLERVVHPIQDASLDQQGYLEINALNNDMIELFGSSDQSRSIASADSATEASILDRHESIKEGDRLGLVKDFLVGIGRKLDFLVQVHINRNEAIRINGPKGEYWQIVRPEDYEEIKGEFEYSVNVGASSARLPHIERSQFIAFFTQVVVAMPAILTKPTLVKRIAEMFGIEDEHIITELIDMGNQIMSGQLQSPSGGSIAGVPEDKPETKIGGQVGGFLGGTANGGGAPGIA